jgi:hypothetical protein
MRVPGAKIPLPLGPLSPPHLPSPSQTPPSGSAWVHQIKHDGYRLMARRDGNRVRLYTRRGYDWSDKYPWIVESLRSLRVRSIIVDGEAVWAGRDGRSDFDGPNRMDGNRHRGERRTHIRSKPKKQFGFPSWACLQPQLNKRCHSALPVGPAQSAKMDFVPPRWRGKPSSRPSLT